MGAYNILFHFDKLYQRFNRNRSRTDVINELHQATPTPLLLIAVLALFWMGCVFGYLALHDMGYGHRGDLQLYEFYIAHIVFGCFIPVVFALLVNADIWWSRGPLIILSLAFFSFYIYKTLNQPWQSDVIAGVVLVQGLIAIGLEGYLVLNRDVSSYFSRLRSSPK